MQKNKIIIANWKMKLGIRESIELAKNYKNKLTRDAAKGKEVVACAPSVALTEVFKVIKSSIIKLGAQNVFWEEKGAYTGEVSPSMLEEAGCGYAIIGHSERRQFLLENYQLIHQKVKAVLDHSKLIPIICVGESLKEKESDNKSDLKDKGDK